MHGGILSSLTLPGDLKRLSNQEMLKVAEEARDLIIDVVSTNGGHLAPCLGVVELTLALLAVMDVPNDRIIWDVGHQCYAYKLLTDRLDRFHTLRRCGGISGFPKPSESPYDAFATGHASTAISAALGIAHGRDLAGEKYRVTAVVGDGALGGGMAWEAINNAGASKADLLVILNDNRMSISPSIGGLATHISRLRAMPLYQSMEDSAERVFRYLPVGAGFFRKTGQMLKRGLTNWVSPTSGTIFEALGFDYFGPIDGHDIGDLRDMIGRARDMKGPVLLHVVTTKGKGYDRAEHKPRRYHGVGPFNASNGKSNDKGRRTYTDVFGRSLVQIAKQNARIVAITAAMPDGVGLTAFAKKYPSRFFDVGIAEQHAVTFAAGLASAGAKPVVAIYSTFLQRAYDQIVHDVCLQSLPVVFAIDRAGFVGEDGPTHHGVFDLSYLRHIPNLTIMVPRDATELGDMLYTAASMDGPVAIRYPRGEACGVRRKTMRKIAIGKAEVLTEGSQVAIITVGPVVYCAIQAAVELGSIGIGARVVDARFVKPLDEATIVAAASQCSATVIVEENCAEGGFASAVLECLARNRALGCNIETLAIPPTFVQHGKSSELLAGCGLTTQGILEAVNRALLRSGITLPSSLDREDEIVIRQGL